MPVPNHIIPHEFAEKLRAARRDQTMKGERRIVTMLFSDVVGSTSASEQLDPEEWTDIINGIFDRMIVPVYQYEGHVARLMGDAILAFFGAPIAHEDDPQRAVLAGLEIIQAIKPYRDEVKVNWGVDIDVRVGINTGLVVVGAVGSDLAMEYTALGDAINLAARMEQTAPPGTVQIAEDTYKQVAPFFETKNLGRIEVKGKRKRVLAYQVLGGKSTPGRLRGIQGLDAPLIGRNSEKAVLQGLVANLDKESGALVCLIGEAGLGKSRLVSELREVVNGRQQADRGEQIAIADRLLLAPDAVWFETASLSYETGQPYSLFQRLIRHMVGVTAADPPEHLADRIGSLIELFPPGEQEDSRLVFESLFGLASRLGQPLLEGEAFKGRLFTVMTALWKALLDHGPAILVCDDLHWTDPASMALLKNLLSLAEQGPLLILCALRPDAHSQGWQVRQVAESEFSQHYTEIWLRPLTPEESSLLVDSLLRISDLPPRLRSRILDRTEGNPFFVEEVVRTLIDSGVVVRDESGSRWQAAGDGQDIDIPDNVRALLTTRIDRLEEGTRSTLQLASVIGRSFYYRVLAGIVDAVDGLDSRLFTLRQAQFIEEAARIPELEYLFRHALTQEAAYRSILRKQRRIYHHRVGETLEFLFPERLEELAGSLALHFFQARDFQKALHYHTSAADNAFRLYTLPEAIDHYNQALDCAAKIDSISSAQRIHLHVRLGRAYELDNRFDAALENYRQMVELAYEREDKALQLASLIAQCVLRASMTPLNDPAQASALANEALNLARELGDLAAEARALSALLMTGYSEGDYQQALAYGQQSLAIARQLGLKEQAGFALHNLANVYMSLNQLEKARQANLDARAIWLELGNTPMLADSYFATISIDQYIGEFASALMAAQEAQRIGRSIGNLWSECVALYYAGLIQVDSGHIGQALQYIHQGLELAEKAGVTPLIYVGFGHLILDYSAAGAADTVDHLAESIYRDRDQQDFFFRTYNLGRAVALKVSLGELQQAELYLAEAYQGTDIDDLLLQFEPVWFADLLLTLAQNRPQQTLTKAMKLVERTRHAGFKLFLPEILMMQGKATAALGKPEQARDLLREAALIAEEIGLRRVLWQILAALTEIEIALGNTTEATIARSRAGEVVEYMLKHVGSDELRESFLSLPEVRELRDRH